MKIFFHRMNLEILLKLNKLFHHLVRIVILCPTVNLIDRLINVILHISGNALIFTKTDFYNFVMSYFVRKECYRFRLDPNLYIVIDCYCNYWCFAYLLRTTKLFRFCGLNFVGLTFVD